MLVIDQIKITIKISEHAIIINVVTVISFVYYTKYLE